MSIDYMLPELSFNSFLICLAMYDTSTFFNWTVKSESREGSDPTLLWISRMTSGQCLTQWKHLKKWLDACLLVCFPIKLDSEIRFWLIQDKEKNFSSVNRKEKPNRNCRRAHPASPARSRRWLSHCFLWEQRCELVDPRILSGKPSAVREPSCPVAHKIATFGRKGVCSI